MKNNQWKNKAADFFLCSNAISKNIGPIDDTILSAVLMRIRAAKNTGKLVVVCGTSSLAERLHDEVKKWISYFKINLSSSFLPDGSADAHTDNAILTDSDDPRTRVLYEMLNNSPDFLFTSVVSGLGHTPDPKKIISSTFTINRGDELAPDILAKRLVNMDYDDEQEVCSPGEFSRRGGIFDIFSLSEDYPVRIEYYDNEIDSMRLFKTETQRSFRETDSYTVILRNDGMTAYGQKQRESKNTADFFEYIDKSNTKIVLIYPDEISQRLEQFSNKDFLDRWNKKIKELDSILFNVYDAAESAAFSEMDSSRKIEQFPVFPANAHIIRNLPEGAEDNFAELVSQTNENLIIQWLLENIDLRIFSQNENGTLIIHSWLSDKGIANDELLHVEQEQIPCSIFIPKMKIACLTERDLFIASFVRWKKHAIEPFTDKNCNNDDESSAEDSIMDLSDLEDGDYVVHVNYGICIYRGLETIKTCGLLTEMMTLEFDDDDILHVPINQSYLLSRYVGTQKNVVKQSKLNSKRWQSIKTNAMNSIQNLALDMLKIQAIRLQTKGSAFSADNLSQRLFEEAFPYHETADQTKCTNEIKHDMESSKPMDRLLCGDVGYGKTEIAMRAAFKCVSNNRQVAVLVPTTVLAQQHYYSFLERFSGTPVIIEQLSRFRTHAEQKEIAERLKRGTIDIVIGTHALVNPKIEFHNLGLIIIDEEQKFGVVQKERLKHLRATIDVLTMTATPIPRTLYMSLAGIRDLSTLMTAPVHRLPVHTIVAQTDDKLIVSAILRELQRGGQVYYIFNRVASIEKEADRLRSMIPSARIEIGHGKMDEKELENVMSDFISGKVDVLVSTTIIESGLDIPNANTIIIDRADRFGLAELYQLRGRVGRWSRQAYAYMLLPRSNIITGDAKKRIAAIRRYTHLGAGFKLAMQDLEIRGSGSILGQEQSGQINAIGFHLYCSLLRSCIQQYQGIAAEIPHESVILLDFLDFALEAMPGHIAACFPIEYIETDKFRMDAYRRLAMIFDLERLDILKKEIQDRFGKMPDPVIYLFQYSEIRILAGIAKLRSVSCHNGMLYLEQQRGLFVKQNGFIPRVPEILPSKERMQLILRYMNELL